MKIFKKLMAKKNGVPFFYKKYWPPYYTCFYKDEKISGCDVVDHNYINKTDEIVPFLTDGNSLHMYRVTGISRAPGNDHIVSPMQYDLEYMKTVKTKPQQMGGTG